MAEIVNEDLALAGLGLQARPNPRRPGKGRVSEGVSGGAERLGVGTPWIRSQNLIGILAVARANAGLVHGGLNSRNEKRSLVGISGGQHRCVVVAPRLVELVLIARKNVVVEDSPRAAQPRGEAFRMSAAGFFRASAIEAAPSLERKAAPSFSARARVCMFMPLSLSRCAGPKFPPLSEIAPWNKALASGEAASMLTAIPPADSPNIVTRPVSPPKPPMLRFTHWSPAIMTSRP